MPAANAAAAPKKTATPKARKTADKKANTLEKKEEKVEKAQTAGTAAEAAKEVETVAAEAAAAETPATATEEAVNVDSLVASIAEHFSSAEKEIRAGKALLKKLQQAHNKDLKAAAAALKNGRRQRVKDPNAPKRAASGIAKPGPISEELAAFLGEDPKVELARTEVIRRVAAYIKEHKLENPDNRREIRPNAELSKLLGTTSQDEISYFNLQKYMSKHFTKTSAKA